MEKMLLYPNSSFAAGFFRILCIFKSINLPVLPNSFGGLPRQTSPSYILKVSKFGVKEVKW